MGTDFSLSIVCHDKELSDAQAQATIQKIADYEARFSRFLPESELSRLNREKDMVVSPLFLEVVDTAYKLFVQTKGIFNPLVQIERLGYSTSFDTLTDTWYRVG